MSTPGSVTRPRAYWAQIPSPSPPGSDTIPIVHRPAAQFNPFYLAGSSPRSWARSAWGPPDKSLLAAYSLGIRFMTNSKSAAVHLRDEVEALVRCLLGASGSSLRKRRGSSLANESRSTSPVLVGWSAENSVAHTITDGRAAPGSDR